MKRICFLLALAVLCLSLAACMPSTMELVGRRWKFENPELSLELGNLGGGTGTLVWEGETLSVRSLFSDHEFVIMDTEDETLFSGTWEFDWRVDTEDETLFSGTWEFDWRGNLRLHLYDTGGADFFGGAYEYITLHPVE